jgi:hypothetical protein
MDLGTVESNLGVQGWFPSIEECAMDIRLVFANAIKYNTSEGNVVARAAKQQLERFEQDYRVL